MVPDDRMTMPAQITKAPSVYEGTLGDLYTGWAKHVLLTASAVEQFHTQFCDYVKSSDPLFLVRQVDNQKRGDILQTTEGNRLRPTDNAPAWWIHHQIFTGQLSQISSFEKFILRVPSHFFEVQRRAPDNVNMAGWHVAHIFDTKDRNVGWRTWDKGELLRRFARNLHPCNYFYVPKRGWRHYGGNRTVIAFFCDKYRSKYRSVWDDFLKLVAGVPYDVPPAASKHWYSTALDKKLGDQHKTSPSSTNPSPQATARPRSPCVPERSNRQSSLCKGVPVAPPNVKVRSWTLRDDNRQHYHRKINIRESPVYLDLYWRKDATVEERIHVGLFCLDLPGLLRGKFIRYDPVDSGGPELRLRVMRADDNEFYVQVRKGDPRIHLQCEGKIGGQANQAMQRTGKAGG